jgi:hypothetical protein
MLPQVVGKVTVSKETVLANIERAEVTLPQLVGRITVVKAPHHANIYSTVVTLEPQAAGIVTLVSFGQFINM